jgi:hypothetical protein
MTTQYSGRPPKWEHHDQNVYFEIPGGGSGRIRIPVQDAATALTTFHTHWPEIEAEAVRRHASGEVVNGEVVMDVYLFDPSFLGK